MLELDSLLQFATSETDSLAIQSQRINIQEQIASISGGLQNTLVVKKEAIQNKAVAALSDLPSPVLSSILESNYYDVNRISLELLATGADSLTAEQFTTISPIAWQCPLEGGDAVYQARVLYHLNENDIFNDNELCIGLASIYFKEEKNDDDEELSSIIGQMKVIPNPANELVQVHINGVEKGISYQVELRDLVGQVLFEERLDNGQTIQMPTAKLPAGIYFCILLEDGILIESNKLIIQH